MGRGLCLPSRRPEVGLALPSGIVVTGRLPQGAGRTGDCINWAWVSQQGLALEGHQSSSWSWQGGHMELGQQRVSREVLDHSDAASWPEAVPQMASLHPRAAWGVATSSMRGCTPGGPLSGPRLHPAPFSHSLPPPPPLKHCQPRMGCVWRPFLRDQWIGGTVPKGALGKALWGEWWTLDIWE